MSELPPGAGYYVGRCGNFIRNVLLGGWLYSSKWQPDDLIIVVYCRPLVDDDDE